jgi:transcription termination/antitermination protein NusG
MNAGYEQHGETGSETKYQGCAGAVAHRRGEAVSYAQILEEVQPWEQQTTPRGDGASLELQSVATDPQWYALWTHSHCEQLVHDQLATKGYEIFLPTVDVWSQRAGVRRRIPMPMFPGYLFLRHAIDKAGYIEVRKTRGLAGILGERWDCLAAVPGEEIEAIRAVLRARAPVLPHAYLRDGQRVRITRGPLANVEGILVRQKPQHGLLVLSVELLQRSVAVEVDCTCVVPV